MPRSMRSPAPTSPTYTSAVSELRGINHRSGEESPIDRRCVHGRSRSNAAVLSEKGGCGRRHRVRHRVRTAAGGFPESSSVSPRDGRWATDHARHGTTAMGDGCHVADPRQPLRGGRVLEDDSERGRFVVGDGTHRQSPKAAEAARGLASRREERGVAPDRTKEALRTSW